MDIATIIGIVAGIACILFAVMSGGSAAIFFHVPSMMIVVGGMLSTTFIHFSLAQVLSIGGVTRKTLLFKMPTPQEVIQKMVNYSAINRRDGALALEQYLEDAGDGFLVKGLQMVIDGTSEEELGKQLELEIDYLQERHEDGRKVLEFMGASAPAFGMIGTLIGLVQMLGTLDSPDKIGEGMAVALITTFYGAILANLIFIPLAGKLQMRSKGETLLRLMIVEGLLGIVRGDSPTGVREKMQAFLSDRKREECKPEI